MKTALKPTKPIALKILSLVDQGLVSGLGKPIPGQMCIEAAVCFAFELPHGDSPPCVGSSVRDFKIKLNDCNWTDESARAKGMRKLSVAQLGSDTIDQQKFKELCALRGTQKLMPIVFERAAKEYPKHEKQLLEFSKECRSAMTLDEAWETAKKFRKSEASASSSASASDSPWASASASAWAWASASASAWDWASDWAWASASASAWAWASASASPWAWASREQDEFLEQIAEMGLGVLIEMKSPGCKYLPLCENIKITKP